MTIIAAADGSALGNPGPAGWAWYVDDSCWAAGGWKHATNNQGELKAVLELFRATAHLDDDLLVLCDSQYVINSVTKWMRGWKAKGWRKGDGKPVMNLDLLKEIDEELVGRRYRFEWVKGHANHPLNEAADVRARGAAEAFQRGTAVKTGPGCVGLGGVVAALGAERAAEERVSEKAAPLTHPELFSFDEAADDADDRPDESGELRSVSEQRSVTLSLGADEHARLVERAGLRGVTVEELLRGLI